MQFYQYLQAVTNCYGFFIMLKKYASEKVFTGTNFIPNATVIFDDSNTVVDIVATEIAGVDVIHIPDILTPGFINAHCHVELSHLKNSIPSKTGLINFITAILQQRTADKNVIQNAIQQAENDMLQNGIVAVGDICNTDDTIHQKQKRNIWYYNFIEVSGWQYAAAEKRFAVMQQVQQQFNAFKSVIVPHAPYSVAKPLWQLLQQQYGQHTITMHNQETAAENELFKTGTGSFLPFYHQFNITEQQFIPTGTTSLQSIYPYIANAKNILLVHNTFITPADISFLQQQQTAVFFCLCPNANIYIENTLPNIPLLLESKLPVVLGTDSLASNNTLSIAAEIQTIIQFYPSIPLETLLQWATLNGAKALQADSVLGSLDKGKQPGLLAFNAANYSVKKLLPAATRF